MTGTYEDFTGDDELTGFDAVVGEFLVENELGGSSDGYHLDHAPGSHSGYSFGGNQMDLSKSPQGQAVFLDILTNARDSSNNLIFSDGAAFYNAHLSAITSVNDPSALDAYADQINAALTSDYGIAAINSAFPIAVTNAENAVTSFIATLKEGNIKTTLEHSPELQAYLIDHYNQFGINPSGSLFHYLNGDSITPHAGPAIQLNDMITLADLKNYLDHTLYATNHSTIYNARQDTINDALVEHEIGKYLSGNSSSNTFTGSDFNDTIDGKGGVDTVYAGNGDDTVIYKASDNSPLYVGNEYLSGGNGDDTLKLEFRSSELTPALREELLDVYNGMVVNHIPGTYSHTFTNLNLEITNFEHLEVWVDGKQVSLDPVAHDAYGLTAYNSTYGSNSNGGNIFWGDVQTHGVSGIYHYETTDTYSFGELSVVNTGTYTTTAGGSITVYNDGNYDYTAPSSYHGQDSFDFTVTDGSGKTSEATLYISNQEIVYDHTQNYTASGAILYHVNVVQNVDYSIVYNSSLHAYVTTLDPTTTVTGSAYDDDITTYEGSDIVHGGAGNDHIAGGGDYSDIDGFSYDPPGTFLGHYFVSNTELYGDDGDDVIHIGSGNVLASGGNGNDIIYGTETNYQHNPYFAKGVVTLEGNDGNDTIISGTDGQDNVYGGNGDDWVYHYLSYGPGITNESDTLDGGAGTDTVIFNFYNSSSSNNGVTVDLAAHTFTYDTVSNSIVNFENVTGSQLNDVLTGSSGDNILDGSYGNDQLYGAAGNDTLIGGAGDDTFLIHLSEGVDKIYDTAGNDKIVFGTGILAENLTYIKDGDDLLIKNNGSDLVRLVDQFVNHDNIETIQFSNNTVMSIMDAYRVIAGNGVIRPGDGSDSNNDNGASSPPPTSITNIHDEINGTTTSYIAPIVIDMSGTGIQSGSNHVYLDTILDGFKVATSWVDPTNALLVIDKNNNGIIDGLSEMIGTGSQDYRILMSAFTDLRLYYDSNYDGKIDSSDAQFANFKIWIDANQDGISQLNELQTLTHAGIQSIDLDSVNGSYAVVDGQYVYTETGTVTLTNNSTLTIGNTWIQQNNLNTIYNPQPADHYNSLNPEVFPLPTLRGFGLVKDLAIQMTLDHDLLTKVASLSNMTETQVLDPSQHFDEKFHDVLYQWVGLPDNWQSHASFADPFEVTFANAIAGKETSIYQWSGSAYANGAWEQSLSYFQGTFLAQTVFHDLFTGTNVHYNVNSGGFDNATGLSSTVLSSIETAIGSSSDPAYSWSLVVRAIDAVIGYDNLSTGDHNALDSAIQSTASGWTLSSIHDLVIAPPQALEAPDNNDTVLTGGFGDDHITGLGGNDTLIGGSGDDYLYGNGGNDIYQPGTGYNFMSDGSGNYTDDTYVYGGGHDAILYDVGGTDKIQFGSGITLSDISIERVNTLDHSNLSLSNTGTDLIIHVAGQGDVDIVNNYGYSSAIESLQFSNSTTLDLVHLDDAITGDYNNNTLTGADRAYYLSDRLIGDYGDDTLNGGLGSNYLEGNSGNDTYIYGGGVDYIRENGDGTDQIVLPTTYNLSDLSFVVTPNDYGLNVLYQGHVIEHIEGQFNYWGIESITNGTDTIDLTTHQFVQYSADDSDVIYGIQNGGSQDNIIHVKNGEETVYAYDGNDTIYGGVGNDHLEGGAGNDTYVYAGGHYTIIDTAGTDVINFGPGITSSNITFAFTSDHLSLDVLVNGTTALTITNHLNPSQAVETLHFDNNSTLDLTGLHAVSGTSGNDTLTGLDNVHLLDDVIYGYAGDDTLSGGAGNNYLQGGSGDDTYIHGSGVDTIYEDYSAGGNDTISFGSGIVASDITLMRDATNHSAMDILVYGNLAVVVKDQFDANPNSVIETLHFNDNSTLDLTTHSIVINGTSGNDQIYGINSAVGGNEIHGLGGYNQLYGADYNDILDSGTGGGYLVGNGGNDTLIGGNGVDTLYGGSDHDTFVFNTTALNNVDTVGDFNSSDDVLNIKDLLSGFTPGTSAITDFVHLTQSGSDMILSVDTDGTGSTRSFQDIATISNVSGLDVDTLYNNSHITVT